MPIAGQNDLGATTTPQSFDRLVPLAKAKTLLLSSITPVAATRHALDAALGRTTAETVRPPAPFPPRRIAMRDGYMVSARETIGATPYAPVYSSVQLPPVRAGAWMSEDTDAVLPPHALIKSTLGAEILQAVAPGTDTREPGGDLPAESVVVEAGTRLRADQIALLALAGIETVALRIPRLCVEGTGPLHRMIEDLASAAGSAIGGGADADITVMLCDPGQAATALAARRLADEGTLVAHGLAIRPGEAIGLGTVPRSDGRQRLVFIVPNSLGDAMAAWLLFIEASLASLAGSVSKLREETLPLARKIVSAPGVADLVLLRRTGMPAPSWDPIAAGDLPWAAISCADAYCLVAPESEGVAPGTLLTGYFL
jgi:molybdopterin molybdotransferase